MIVTHQMKNTVHEQIYQLSCYTCAIFFSLAHSSVIAKHDIPQERRVFILDEVINEFIIIIELRKAEDIRYTVLSVL